jgi:FtsH-binding integral membrane protein
MGGAAIHRSRWLGAKASPVWFGFWLALGLVGLGFAGWWAVDALFGNDCTSFTARTDRSKLLLGLAVVGIPVGAWLAARTSPAILGTNRGQLAYLLVAALLLTTALIARDHVGSWPIIDELAGKSAGCLA